LVPIHNDSSFLYTSPPSAIGFWFALEKCEKQNGCLWFLPGSHKRARIRKRFVRRADGGGTEFQPVPGEEGEEERWNEKEFVPEECDVGTLVLIHGEIAAVLLGVHEGFMCLILM
jgi:phytanoyl-CoA hydroxylase